MSWLAGFFLPFQYRPYSGRFGISGNFIVQKPVRQFITELSFSIIRERVEAYVLLLSHFL